MVDFSPFLCEVLGTWGSVPLVDALPLSIMCTLLFSGEDVTSLYLSLARQPEGCDHTPAQFVYYFNISYIPGVGTQVACPPFYVLLYHHV